MDDQQRKAQIYVMGRVPLDDLKDALTRILDALTTAHPDLDNKVTDLVNSRFLSERLFNALPEPKEVALGIFLISGLRQWLDVCAEGKTIVLGKKPNGEGSKPDGDPS